MYEYSRELHETDCFFCRQLPAKDCPPTARQRMFLNIISSCQVAIKAANAPEQKKVFNVQFLFCYEGR